MGLGNGLEEMQRYFILVDSPEDQRLRTGLQRTGGAIGKCTRYGTVRMT